VNPIRQDFPLLSRSSRGVPLVYLDNAATTQKPQQVIDAVSRYYGHYNANVHRGVHEVAEEATRAYEASRSAVVRFINAPGESTVVFTKGTTEAINLVASGLRSRLAAGDEILITCMEHHANIVPWQMLAEATGARLVAADIDDDGNVDLEDYRRKLGDRTRIAAFGHVSNALGTINPVADMVAAARNAGALTLVDGAQAVAHLAVDVQALDCDFYAFSGHKLFGPTGIGVLYGRESQLEELPPYQGGGEMIERVTLEHTSYNRLPYKFEAGTPNMAGAIGLGTAIDYLDGLDRPALLAAEDALIERTLGELMELNGVTLVGRPERRLSVISFLVAGSHPNDIGTLLDQQGIAVRTGHHCAMPLMDRLGVPGTVRASFSLYNDDDDAQRFVDGVHKALSFL